MNVRSGSSARTQGFNCAGSTPARLPRCEPTEPSSRMTERHDGRERPPRFVQNAEKRRDNPTVQTMAIIKRLGPRDNRWQRGRESLATPDTLRNLHTMGILQSITHNPHGEPMAMKRYTPEELQTVISEHKKWLMDDGGSRANLSRADLSRADLSGANLSGANLSGANLYGVNVKKAAAFNGLYKYIAMPVIAEDGTEHIRLGCHFRSVSDWASDFWNNPSEFPNDGSVQSQLRLLAYNTCLEWLKINR